jgi:hypothetical protein
MLICFGNEETDTTGEVHGSLVSGLLMDGSNTKRLVYGSLMNHARARFMDLLQSTWSVYRY